MNLFSIKESVQEVAEAIASVLKVDVTIINTDCTRVAATGIYKKDIGKRLPENCSFENIIKNKKPEYIRKPNLSEKCSVCDLRGSCIELSTLGYPIVSEGELIGVIGLIAFDNMQAKRIYDDFNSLNNFLNKLGKLLAGDLKYHGTIRNLIIEQKRIKSIINGLINGVICTNEEDKIMFINDKILNYFQLDKSEILNKDINEIIPEFKEKYKTLSPIEMKMNIKKSKKSFMINIIPITLENEKIGDIIEIHKTSQFVRNALKILDRENNITFDDIIGSSSQIVEVKNLAKQVSPSQSTVLIRGESGTGKELFAQSIHNASYRKDKPFVAINCASIPDNLLESELFGYETGAFTGASKSGKIGKFELANEGTLFLDEIGDLPLHLQPKLLRVLQDQAFMKIGGSELININFRLIAATNRNLEEMILKNEFREDLYYRLNVIPIKIPPIRQRREDIRVLSNHLLVKYCKRLETKQKYFDEKAEKAFENYNWPGNVRELENIIEYLVNIVTRSIITIDDLPNTIKYSQQENPCMSSKQKGLKEYMDEYEKNILINYMNQYGDTKTGKKEISKLLNIDLSTLYRKLNKYGLG